MSFFSQKLKELLDRKELTQSDLFRLTRLSTAHISNLVNDVQPRVSLEDMQLIAVNITHDPKERAELVRAHLMDECVGPGSELVEVRIKGGESPKPSEPTPLAPKKERALEIFRQHGNNLHLWATLDSLADLMQNEPVTPAVAPTGASDSLVASLSKISTTGRHQTPGRRTKSSKPS